VPDANFFTGYVWVERLLIDVQRDRIRLFWSPKIVEEVARVRLWIWIKKAFRRNRPPTGSSGWKALWVRYSEDAHAWFARVSPHIRVIEDQPPHEPAWVDPHPDPNDAWLWNTARRVDADFVVTVNLKDGPPVDFEGARRHERIAYVHPDVLMALLDVWGDIVETGAIPEDIAGELRGAAGSGGTLDTQAIAAQIRAILARMAEEDETA
jgi:hypothetical protein